MADRRRKLTEADVIAIRRDIAVRDAIGSNSEIADRYGVSAATIGEIARGLLWKRVKVAA